MKKLIAALLVCSLMMAMVACGSTGNAPAPAPAPAAPASSTAPTAESSAAAEPAPAQVIEMKLGHYAAADHPGALAAQQFADNVEKRTNGAIKISVYPNNELGAPNEMLEQNILGAIDMSLGTQGSLDKYSKKFAVVMLPFAFDNYQHAYDVLDGPFYDWVKNDLESQGLIMLGSWDYGFRNLTNNTRPVNTPDDVSGMKLRTPPEIQLQSCMEALGANVQKIAFNELYLSLQQNLIDGQENPLAVIYYNKFYECQKYLALTNHVYNSMVHVVSKKTWDKLTPEQQTIVREESASAAAFMRNEIQSSEADLVEKLKAAGMEVTTPDITAFRDKMGPSYKAIADYAGQENVDKFMEILESMRK